MRHIVSVSGGKDSTALWLWALRQGLELVPVFLDTRWEAAETYAYLAELERRLGPVHRVDSEGFEERTRRGGTFPSRQRRWCTKDLKVYTFARWLDAYREKTGEDVTVLVGIRAEESRQRASMSEREWNNDYDCEVWRPLINWTLAQVLEEHHRAGVPVNPLYQHGAERVGCWPCIYGGKAEISLVARHDPERIARIRAIEADIGQTMFAYEPPTVGGERQPLRAMPIDEAVTWANTSRGGRDLLLFPEPSGCMRWGLCEPKKGGKE
jgi:3'-phosphoadenosine 5'-phosphosulfate sulfotransferase (PAPS reductase)/FAD synthetase